MKDIEFDAEKYEFEYKVTETDLDVFGHVNNAQYFRIYEAARWDFITKNGYGLEKIEKEQKGPVLLETAAKFKRELKLGDSVVIHSEADNFNGKILTLKQQIRREGKVCSEASFSIAYFDLEKRKLAKPDLDWLKACGIILKN